MYQYMTAFNKRLSPVALKGKYQSLKTFPGQVKLLQKNYMSTPKKAVYISAQFFSKPNHLFILRTYVNVYVRKQVAGVKILPIFGSVCYLVTFMC